MVRRKTVCFQTRSGRVCFKARSRDGLAGALPANCPRFTASQALNAARDLHVDLVALGVTSTMLAEGMTVEREHADIGGCTALTAARIALAHLRERSDYYARLKRFVER